MPASPANAVQGRGAGIAWDGKLVILPLAALEPGLGAIGAAPGPEIGDGFFGKPLALTAAL